MQHDASPDATTPATVDRAFADAFEQLQKLAEANGNDTTCLKVERWVYRDGDAQRCGGSRVSIWSTRWHQHFEANTFVDALALYKRGPSAGDLERRRNELRAELAKLEADAEARR